MRTPIVSIESRLRFTRTPFELGQPREIREPEHQEETHECPRCQSTLKWVEGEVYECPVCGDDWDEPPEHPDPDDLRGRLDPIL